MRAGLVGVAAALWGLTPACRVLGRRPPRELELEAEDHEESRAQPHWEALPAALGDGGSWPADAAWELLAEHVGPMGGKASSRARQVGLAMGERAGEGWERACEAARKLMREASGPEAWLRLADEAAAEAAEATAAAWPMAS